MKECLDTDTIVNVAAALDWDVAEGLRHLNTCDDCRARIDTLRFTHAAMSEVNAAPDAALARVADALKAEAREESARARRMDRWASALEAALAGVGAPLVLASSGIQIGSIAVGFVAAALGAALLLYGKRLRLYA
jgi:predicted anti-sigma-YlaC factor YlaD